VTSGEHGEAALRNDFSFGEFGYGCNTGVRQARLGALRRWNDCNVPGELPDEAQAPENL